MTPKTSNQRLLLSAALAATALTACKAPQAFGDRNVVIVRADPGLWAQVDSTVIRALEQRVFTTRPERKFEVTFVAVGDTLWNDFRLWQQIVVLGTAEDDIVGRIRDAAGQRDATPPALIQARDIWARNQLLTALLLPADGQAGAVGSLLPELYATLDRLYGEWIAERMFTSGVNDSLMNALTSHGFSLRLPRVYLHTRKDSIFRFGNPYRQGDTDLLRSVLVTWRPGLGTLTPDTLRAWRVATARTQYDPPQNVLADGLRYDTVSVHGLSGLELRGVWRDQAPFPAAGPFVARAVTCPAQNRTYYLDAWLFAPGADKYPYLRQLEIVIDSFRCVDGSSRPAEGVASGAAASAD